MGRPTNNLCVDLKRRVLLSLTLTSSTVALRMEQESGGGSVIRHAIKNWMLGRGKVAVAESALRQEARLVHTDRQ